MLILATFWKSTTHARKISSSVWLLTDCPFVDESSAKIQINVHNLL